MSVIVDNYQIYLTLIFADIPSMNKKFRGRNHAMIDLKFVSGVVGNDCTIFRNLKTILF